MLLPASCMRFAWSHQVIWKVQLDAILIWKWKSSGWKCISITQTCNETFKSINYQSSRTFVCFSLRKWSAPLGIYWRLSRSEMNQMRDRIKIFVLPDRSSYRKLQRLWIIFCFKKKSWKKDFLFDILNKEFSQVHTWKFSDDSLRLILADFLLKKVRTFSRRQTIPITNSRC